MQETACLDFPDVPNTELVAALERTPEQAVKGLDLWKRRGATSNLAWVDPVRIATLDDRVRAEQVLAGYGARVRCRARA